jgi:hypothetical protein
MFQQFFPLSTKKKSIPKSALARHVRLLKKKERQGTSKVPKLQEIESLASDIEMGKIKN